MAPRSPNNQDLSHDILNSFISDDEDQDQLGNEHGFDTDEDDADDELDARSHSDDGNDTDDDDDDDQQTRQRQSPTEDVDDEDSKQDRFSFKEDRAGNFVDRDGKIIIRAGKQRDLFVKLKKRWLKEEKQRKELTDRFGQTVSAAQQLLDRYKALKQERTDFDNRGLSKDEIKTASDLAVMMKVDPKAAVRKLLTMLHMNGTDLKDIGVTGPVDAAEVARIIEQRSRPKEKTEEEKVREQANAFLERHPAAARHTGVIAEAKRRFPHMSLDEIWYQLLLHAKDKKAKADGRGTGDDRQKPNRVPPNNGGSRDDGSQRRQQQGKKLSLNAVDPSQSFSQIGRDLLRDLKAIEGN